MGFVLINPGIQLLMPHNRGIKMGDVFDDLIGAPDFDDTPKAKRQLGLVVGPKRSPAELDARYGGPQPLATVELIMHVA